MVAFDLEHEKARHEQELSVQRQISFASGLFQGDITIRTLLESLAEGVIIIDSSGTILLVNISAEKMFGYPREDFIGKPQAVLIPERFRKVLEDHEADYFKEPRISPMRQLLDLAGNRRDGSEFPVEISLGFIETINGVFVLAFVSDITLRKQLETEIQDAREYAENIVETVREPLVVLNSDLRVLTANHSFYNTFQVTPEETIGNFIYDLGNRQWDIPKLRVLFEEILPQNTVFNDYEVEHDFLDIGRKIILLNARQIFRENIGSHIILLAMEDITERKFAEEQIKILNTSLVARASELEEANRELETFNYSVAHDLRTPLTVLSGYLGILRELCGDEIKGQCVEYIRNAYEGARKMDQLIDALLEFSRFGRIEPSRETVDLGGLAQEIVQELQLAEPQRRVTVRIAGRGEIIGDPSLLRVVLANLLGNAWKFTRMQEGAVIEFGVTKINGETTWFVRDNGPGFEKADAENIFVPFQRLRGSTNVGGHGIGLATVARIIQRHGGRIWAEGEPGKGATFYFNVPAMESRTSADDTTSLERPLHILLAEDDPGVRSLMVEMMLRRYGWEIEIAENGKQAVEKWEKGGIDVVLMDIQMPEMDGIAATRQIRKREGDEAKRACIIALTAHALPEDREKCLEAGMNGFLSKPMQMDELDSAIKSCLH